MDIRTSSYQRPSWSTHSRYRASSTDPRLLVGADPGGVDRSHAELNAVQAHLAEPVVDDDAHRVRAVATTDVLTAEGDPERRTPVLGAHAPQVDVADQHRRIVERLDGEAEVVLLVRAPLRDALLRRGLRRRGHPVRQRGHASWIHLPLRERGQVVITHAAQSHPLTDEDRVAVAECAGNIGEFGHVTDTAACQTRDVTRSRPCEPGAFGGPEQAPGLIAAACRLPHQFSISSGSARPD